MCESRPLSLICVQNLLLNFVSLQLSSINLVVMQTLCHHCRVLEHAVSVSRFVFPAVLFHFWLNLICFGHVVASAERLPLLVVSNGSYMCAYFCSRLLLSISVSLTVEASPT